MILRLLTYNIHKCIGGIDRRYRPERVIEAIRHETPDMVFLQEVDEATRRSNRDRQVDLLGDALGLRHRSFVPNVVVRGGGRYGNAILSRFPISSSHNVDLTLPGRKRRSGLHARVRVRIGEHTRTLHVFNLHLGLSDAERRQQIQRLLVSDPFFRLHGRTPIVVAGDFNDVWGSIARELILVGFRGPPARFPTFPAWAPVRALDAVFVRGDLGLRHIARPRSNLARTASDHLPVVAEVAFGPAAP